MCNQSRSYSSNSLTFARSSVCNDANDVKLFVLVFFPGCHLEMQTGHLEVADEVHAAAVDAGPFALRAVDRQIAIVKHLEHRRELPRDHVPAYKIIHADALISDSRIPSHRI